MSEFLEQIARELHELGSGEISESDMISWCNNLAIALDKYNLEQKDVDATPPPVDPRVVKALQAIGTWAGPDLTVKIYNALYYPEIF